MINVEQAKRFCCDDISLIEGYDLAIADKTQVWYCHHRLEKALDLSKSELIEQNLYYHRPSQELIFMKPTEHHRLHKKGENYPMYEKHRSEETRQKISQNHAKYWKDKHLSEETRQKISAAKKRHPMSAETKAKISAAKKGKALSDEHRDKIKISWEKRSHTLSLGQRAKISAAQKGKVLSEETRQKMSEAKRAYWSLKREQKLQEEL